MSRGGRIKLGAAVAVVVVALGAGGALWVKHHRAAALCQQVTAETAALHERTPVTQGKPTAVILGDSWAAGTYLTDPRQAAWGTLLGRAEGWTTYLNAVGGTGYVNGGVCGGENFQSRVGDVLALHPSVVVVEGGLNDDDAGAVRSAAHRLLTSLASVPTVVVVGAPSAPARPHVPQVDQALQGAAKAANRVFVSTDRLTLPYRDDGLHMQRPGHGLFANAVAASISTPAA